MNARTDYERFESSSIENRRLLRQEELILAVSIALCEAMEKEKLSKAGLAERLNRSPAFVTQILSGGRNLTLRTLADVADALDSRVSIQLRKRDALGIVVPLPMAQINGWQWDQRNPVQIVSEHPHGESIARSSKEVAA